MRGRISDIASGDGPVAAAFAAVQRITGTDVDIISLETRMRANGSGREFVADIEVEIDGRRYSGRARGPDIVTAAIDALLFTLDRGEAYDRAEANQPTPAHAV